MNRHTLPVIRFRDPPPVEERFGELRLEIAKILFNAPSLPLALPRFGFELADLDLAAARVGLRLTRNNVELATLFLEWPEGAERVQSTLRWDGGDRDPTTRALLDALIARLRVAVDRARWDRAAERIETLLDLPRNVPMSAFRQLVPGVRSSEGLVRTGFNCNQDCGLCWQGRSWGRVDAETVLTWIEDLRLGGAERLTISGGEPTLDPSLPRYVERGRELGYSVITLETNALQLAKRGHVDRLREAGLTHAFVSLHSGDPAVSDRITSAPGTHARTILGIQALLDRGIRVTLNAVITTEGIDHIAALPDFVHKTFGAHPNLDALVISDAGDSYDADLIPKLVPHPDRMREVLPEVIDRAEALGLRLQGLGAACGPHLCLFGADARAVTIDPIASSVDFREYLPGCNVCSLKYACLGVRSSHVRVYGDDCIRPFPKATPTT